MKMSYEIIQKWNKTSDEYRLIGFANDLKTAEKKAKAESKKGNETAVVHEPTRGTVYRFKNGRETYRPKEWGPKTKVALKRDSKGRFKKG
jgi:hypothetical protein